MLGTGDLSELALGWCTYGVGDQMSHYGVNAGVPKTLIQHLIRWVIDSGQCPEGAATPPTCSREILAQEITPELVPTPGGQAAGDRGLRRPVRPAGLHALPRAPPRLPAAPRSPSSPGTRGATRARGSGRRASRRSARTAYDLATVREWLVVFVQRFFASQFKRSALPERPQGLRGRHDVAARRLADAVGRRSDRVARRDRTRRSALVVGPVGRIPMSHARTTLVGLIAALLARCNSPGLFGV